MGGTALAPQRVMAIKPRKYFHIDPPLSEDRRKNFSVTAETVARHSFLPFIGFDQIERRIDFDAEPFWKITDKSRPIRYASHNDSAIHSYYGGELAERYEARLAADKLEAAVLAYRSGIGSNIEFAKALFDEVRTRGSCLVACYDVTKFFDSMRHDRLEEAILAVQGRSKLTRDWVAVFRRITEYEWVDSKQLKRAVGRSKQPHRLCSIEQFRTKVRPFVNRNETGVGIPQGSPLSGLLANVYMRSFDARMQALVSQFGGSYRRYSDDIAVVLPDESRLSDVELAMSIMLLDLGLRLNENKTAVTRVSPSAEVQICEGAPLQYLGFIYDGIRVLLRPSSLARFYRKMKAAIRIAVRAAYHAGYPKDEIRRRTLVGKYTHWGDRKNFVQYAFKASRIMESPEIRGQLRNHAKIFRETLDKYRDRYYR